MGRWSWIAALFLALGLAQPVGALHIPAGDLLEVTRPRAAQLLGFRIPELSLNYLDLALPTDSMEVRESELIRDENLNTLHAFSASDASALPIVSAQIYIIHATRVSQMKKTPITEVDEWEELARRRALPGMAWVMGPTPSERARVTERALAEKRSGWGFMSWLTEDEGLFSGRPWDWDNFLPRILTAAGLILGLLVAVEFMHMLVVVGLRGIGGKQRRSRVH